MAWNKTYNSLFTQSRIPIAVKSRETMPFGRRKWLLRCRDGRRHQLRDCKALRLIVMGLLSPEGRAAVFWSCKALLLIELRLLDLGRSAAVLPSYKALRLVRLRLLRPERPAAVLGSRKALRLDELGLLDLRRTAAVLRRSVIIAALVDVRLYLGL